MKINKILFLLLFFPFIIFSQHTIKVTFYPANDFTWAILYKNAPTNTKYIAQSRIVDGDLVFILDEEATTGIYKLVYAVPQNDYNFDIIYNGKEDIELTFNLIDGVVFQKSDENIMLQSYLTEMTLLGNDIETKYLEESTEDTMSFIFKKQKKLQRSYEEKSEGTLVNHFIKANQPYIPNELETLGDYIKNVTADYFTNIQFNDEVLQSSNFLIEKSLAYINGTVTEGISKEQSLKNNVDKVEDQTRLLDLNFQKYFIEKLWKNLVNYNLISTANYLAERYLIPIANQLNDTVLVLKLTQFKNLSIGNPAPDFILDDGSGKKLSELDIAENYILVFWSSGCSHCLKEIPQLYQLSQELNTTKYKIIAVGLEEDTFKWTNEVVKYPNFINVVKLKKWNNTIVSEYGLTITPTYFVLDKDKRFLVKPENFDDLKAYLKK
ncbi:TlpA family protein disulfide reductase [Flavobacteriaceae bacterium]|nr:TlpA family protein disulfide reductase [Flavobacteriaceae bacterium]